MKGIQPRSNAILLAMGLTLVGTDTAGAQDAAAAPAATSEVTSIEAIVVTARRREENLQETPISITALTADGMAAAQVTSTTDLTRVTPNLQFTSQAPASGNNASSQIFIRGIGQTDYLPSTDPGVGLYIDGVYVARSVGGAMDFGDIERVEVLRGPQGTLFGRNTIGGAISIISKRPAKEFGGSAEVKGGSKNRLDVRGSIDVPLGDTLFSKFNVVNRNQDGYVRRLSDGIDLGDVNSTSGRMALLFDPESSFSAYLIADYTRKDENGAPQVFNRINPAAGFARLASTQAGCPAPGTELADPRCANNQFNAGPYATNGTAPLKSNSTVWGTSLTLELAAGDIDYKSITAYRSTEWEGFRDADNTPFTILHTQIANDTHQFSQELQASGEAFDERLQWLVGAYYFDERSTDDFNVFVAPGGFTQNGTYENSALAGFTQLTYDFTDALSLTVGGRYGTEQRRFSPALGTISTYSFPQIPGFNNTANPAPVNTPTSPGFTVLRVIDGVTYIRPVSTVLPGDVVLRPNAAGNLVVPANAMFYEPGQREEETTDFMPMASLGYQWTDQVFTYLTYSEGFKAGGHSTRSTRPFPDVPAFAPEKARSLELGFKTDLFDGHVRLNGAAFVSDYEDIQIVVREGFAPLIVNGGEASIWGGELEWIVQPIARLSITGGLGYNENEYDSLSAPAIANGVVPDNRLAFSPKLSGNAGVSYDIAVGGLTITPHIDYYYQSKVYFDAANSEAIAQPSYGIVNASVSIGNDLQHWQVVASVTNAADELYRIAGFSALDSAAAYAESTYARGREWTLAVRYEF